MRKICGIYCIKNIYRNKMYIGKSIDIDSRIRQHYSKLHNNKHHSHKLQNSWNKYPDEYFISGIIEECSFNTLDEREKYYIDFYDAYNNGFNEALPTGVNCGHIFSDEDRRKHSIIMKRAHRLMSKESKQKIVDGIIRSHQLGLHNYDNKIILYDSIKFECVMEFKSTKDCAKFLHSNVKSIGRIITRIKCHEKLSYKGFILIRDDDNYTINDYLKSRDDYIVSVKCRAILRSGLSIINNFKREYRHKLKLRNNTDARNAAWKKNSLLAQDALRRSCKLAVDIYLFNTGEYIGRWNLLSDFAVERGLNLKYLQRAMSGERRHHKNFVVKKVN